MNQPNPTLSRFASFFSSRARRQGIVLAGTGLLVLMGGCADPLMHRSQLPEKIDYSGVDTRQAPALPTQPATAPSAEALKPASLPATPTSAPALPALPATTPLPPATGPSESTHAAEVNPATAPASTVPATEPSTQGSGATKPGV